MPVYVIEGLLSMLFRHNSYMDLRIVSYFIAVAEAGSVNAASKVLLVGQPSLSRQLRKLERSLGVQLLTRGSRAEPTAAGIAFLEIARDLISKSDQAEAAARGLAHNQSVRLTIAGPPTTVADVIAPFIAMAGEECPLTNIRERAPREIYQELISGRADLVVGTNPPPSHFSSHVIGQAPIWAQVPSDHPLVVRKTISLVELSLHSIAIVDDTNNVRRNFDAVMTQEGIGARATFETQSSHASQALAAAHKAICITSDDSRFGLASLYIQPAFTSQPLNITLFAAWDPMHYAARKIAETVRSLEVFYSNRALTLSL